MKVLQVLDSYPPDLNGGAYFTHRLSKQLIEQNIEILVICPSRSRKTHYCEYDGVKLFRVKSYPVILYKDFRICLPFGINNDISNAINNFSPDVIHLQGRFILGDICGNMAKKYNTPTVTTNHFMPDNFFHYLRLPDLFKTLFEKLAWSWVKDFFEKGNAKTTPTQSAANLLIKNGFSSDIKVISCGIDTERFNPNGKLQSYNGITKETGEKILLYAGRLDKEKNINVIIDAFFKIQNEIKCRLLIVGNGDERERIIAHVTDLNLKDHVVFCGYLHDDDYPEIFKIADCFIHAGTAELQSIVTLEAIASGLPVVAVNAMALPELVQHNTNGLLFEPNDSSMAAKYALKILSDESLRDSMSIASRRISLSHNINLTGEKFHAIYSALSQS